MTGPWLNWRKMWISIGIVLGVMALAIWWQYRTDLAVAQAAVAMIRAWPLPRHWSRGVSG